MADASKNLGEGENQSKVNPPITMKVDAPAEDTQPESEDNEKNSNKLKENEDFKMCSPLNKVPLAPVTSNPFTQSSRGILKPPQLSLNNSKNSTGKSFVLNPSRLNPFAATNQSEAESNEDKKNTLVNGETPKFVPLINSEAKNSQSSTKGPVVASSSSFIFGQNIQDRVVASDKNDEPKPSTSVNSNGTTEMLFSSAVKHDRKSEAGASNKEVKSLSESAREYEESRANKRKYEEVEVITGEEGETNILKVTCKLFAFDKSTGSWQERGRGVLRLNDLEGGDHTQSRLVFRTTGSLRVVLNTKVWAEMTVEQASEKSVRFTALDSNGVIKVFLAMATIEDSKQLFSQLESRVQKEQALQKHKKIDSGGNN